MESKSLRSILETIKSKFTIDKLSFETPICKFDVEICEDDKIAAWEMYIELITRIATQPLSDDTGVEKAALSSLHSLFGITREILKERGRKAKSFSVLAIVVLNTVLRDFMTKWHRISEEKGFDKDCASYTDNCKKFRTELVDIQNQLRYYSYVLAELSDQSDLPMLIEEAADKLK